ncbi:MAG: Gfo/Idh/MocA family oxidoreductase [Kiloniellaceae bacterium]
MSGVDIWLIVGARRWGRLMAAELCARLPDDAIVYLQTATPGDPGLQSWLNRTGLRERLRITDRAPVHSPSNTSVAFVVNSAYRHSATIEELLEARYNVVSEKPMTFSAADTRRLVTLAGSLDLRLFCTNTYLFPDYLNLFRRTWPEGERMSRICVTWIDPAGEARHGDAKSYDSGVPVIFDVLPHVANIVAAVYGPIAPGSSEIQVERGGAEVFLTYGCDELTVQAHIARNGEGRKRVVELSGRNSKAMLDFSTEPGTIRVDGGPPGSADPDWPQKERPIGAMLASVLAYFEEGAEDARLSADSAILGNALSDAVAVDYAHQQAAFLARFDRGAVLPSEEADLAYADKESRSIAQRALPFLSPDSPLRLYARG